MSPALGHVTIYFGIDLSLTSFSIGDPHHYFTTLYSLFLIDTELLSGFITPNSAVCLRSALILSRFHHYPPLFLLKFKALLQSAVQLRGEIPLKLLQELLQSQSRVWSQEPLPYWFLLISAFSHI